MTARQSPRGTALCIRLPYSMTQEIILVLSILKLLKSEAFKLTYALINIHITQGTNVHQFKVESFVTTLPLEISYRFKASLT